MTEHRRSRKKRIMQAFKIQEISAVDRPAQTLAQMTIMKRGDPPIVGALTSMHDEAPSGERRAIAALIGRVEDALAKRDEVNLALLAGQVEEVARGRLDALVAAVRDSTGVGTEDAQRAVRASRAGQALDEVIDLAQAMTRAADSVPEISAAQADKRLDELAKARAAERGENFYNAYEAVCGANPELVAKAVGQPEPLPSELSTDEFDYDLAVRSSPMSRDLEAGIAARKAERSLFKRAREIQVERAVERLLLTEALEVAKAERPELAKRARI